MRKWWIILAAVLESAMIAVLFQLSAPAPSSATASGTTPAGTAGAVASPPASPGSPLASTARSTVPRPSPTLTTPPPTPTLPPPTPLPTSTPRPVATDTPLPSPTRVPPTATRRPPPTNTPRPTVGYVGNTNGQGVYLRHSPNPNDLWVAWPDDTPLTILGPQASVDGQPWLQVRDPAGDVGWVPARYVVIPAAGGKP